jgi:hypothetical protein
MLPPMAVAKNARDLSAFGVRAYCRRPGKQGQGEADMEAAELLGTWRLIEYHNRTEDGKMLDPSFGPEAMGVIHFNANGRMLVVLTDGRRSLPPGVERRPFSAYTGIWEFDGETVKTAVDESAWPHFVGTMQNRGVRYANGRLSLIPATVVVDGVVNHREVVWEKISEL